MNQLKQNIAIAEACGWKDCARTIHVFHANGRESRSERIEGINPKDGQLACVPAYTTDLNAMHEAEKTVRQPGLAAWSEYARLLQKICDQSLSSYLHATAPQRAEAFLKTIGKWEEQNTEK